MFNNVTLIIFFTLAILILKSYNLALYHIWRIYFVKFVQKLK